MGVNDRGYIFQGDPATESSVSIDGVRLADFGVHLLDESAEPALPQTRDNTLTIPGRHGEYDFGSYFGARPLDLACGINNQASLSDVQKLVRELNTLLLDEYGRPKTVRLVYDYEPDKHYNAKFSGAMPIERIARAGTFVIPMTASDPFAYSDSDAYDQDAILYDTGKQYDNGIMYQNKGVVNWLYSRHYSGAHNYNLYVSPFSFVVEGAVINPKFTNLTTGKIFSINTVVARDERLYIDSEKYMVWKIKTVLDDYYWSAPEYIVADRFKWERINLHREVKGDFPQLVQGDNGFLFEGNLPNAIINFNWKHKSM